MRAAALALLFVSATAIAIVACDDGMDSATGDVCAQARHVFAACGASLPLLEDGTCAGTSKIVATCVVDHATNCDELGTLAGRLDSCVSDVLDGGDALLPAPDDLPLPARDAGAKDSSVTPVQPLNDAGPLPVVDAGFDSGSVATGIALTDTVAQDQEKHYATPVLPPGTYTFAMTGNGGDADLYVEVHTVPNTAHYDCRPFLAGSNETCSIALTTTDSIQVMVRGEDTTSTFTLQGTP